MINRGLIIQALLNYIITVQNKIDLLERELRRYKSTNLENDYVRRVNDEILNNKIKLKEIEQQISDLENGEY